jgi:hypothetical protein
VRAGTPWARRAAVDQATRFAAPRLFVDTRDGQVGEVGVAELEDGVEVGEKTGRRDGGIGVDAPHREAWIHGELPALLESVDSSRAVTRSVYRPDFPAN